MLNYSSTLGCKIWNIFEKSKLTGPFVIIKEARLWFLLILWTVGSNFCFKFDWIRKKYLLSFSMKMSGNQVCTRNNRIRLNFEYHVETMPSIFYFLYHRAVLLKLASVAVLVITLFTTYDDHDCREVSVYSIMKRQLPYRTKQYRTKVAKFS